MTSDGANIEAIYPLTHVQEGILFHSLYSPDSPLYFQQYTCLLEGTLEVDVFRRSWQRTIDRQPAMRSMLAWEGRERPLQIVRSRVRPEWRVEDWRNELETASDQRLQGFLEADRGRGFHLDTAPLMRFALFRVDDDAYRFVWSHHHIILDGWSLGLALHEVFTNYDRFRSGVEPHVPPPPSYRDYVRWVRSQDLGAAESFWRAALDGVETPTPTRIGSRTSDRSPWAERHAEESIRIDPDPAARLRAFARQNGLTLNTMLRGAWALVLRRYSGRDDVVFGATVSGRPPELDGSLEMVGLFINTVPVRVQIEPARSVVDWLGGVQQWQVDASPFDATPLVALQRWTGAPAGEPLFESLLAFENVPEATDATGEMKSSDVRYLQRSNYPLALLVMPGDSIEIVVLYDSDRFDRDIIRRMTRQLGVVLESMVDRPDGPLHALPFFPPDELHEIVTTWNATEADYPAQDTMHQLVDATAAARPESIAVVGDGCDLSYTELDARADAIAARLTELGIEPDDRVGVAFERSPGMIVAILGVLRAGGAYVPLDPTLPHARLRFLLEDTAARAIVAGAGVDPGAWASPTDAVPVLRVGESGMLHRDAAGPETVSARPGVSPDHLAYVMYTSGSTGRPKGVAVTHRSLVNSTHARVHAYGSPVESFLLLSPFFFDSSVAGIFSSLAQGGTLVLPAPRMEQDVHHLANLIATHRVTHTLALPSVYQLLLELADVEKLRTLRLVMVAGETCPPALVGEHYSRLPDTALVNEYGPTEATVWCTVHFTDRATAEVGSSSDRVPIGRPIANTQAFVLDVLGRPAPVGVPGELHIGGVGLARGYLGRPGPTGERFVERHIIARGPTRLYRTGDVARYLPDGSLDLLGRMDDQVKIRGHRIELGEVEAVLGEYPGVRDAVATVRTGGAGSGSEKLIAYVEGSAEPDAVRTFAADRLHEAMVPTSIVSMERLPRGPTGKVDRSSLPAPESMVVAETNVFVAPAGPAEETLAAIWSDVLDREEIGATDNFFEIGGDSIASIRVIARAHQAGLEITPRQLFENPTIADLAARTVTDRGEKSAE